MQVRPRNYLFSLIACATLLSGVALMPAASSAATAPKVFSASLSSFGGDPTELQITITNDSTGAAVLGSATITAPSGVTLSGTPTIVDITSGKVWTASRKNNVIKLGAVSDPNKLMPGQYVTVDFLASVPTTGGQYTFAVVAKPSLGFTGSATFSQLGPSPTITICGSDPGCSTSNGDVNNPPPNREVGQFSLDDSCTGCNINISNTPGDFCSTTPPGQCKAPVVPQFEVDPGYFGNVHFTLACDKTNCPLITGGGGTAGADYYPTYYTDSNAPTDSEQFVQILDDCSFTDGVAPCVESQSRISEGPGAGDLQTVIKLFFGSGGDPRVAH